MKRIIVALAFLSVLLPGSLAVSPAASSADGRLTLRQPVEVTATQVRLFGRVSAPYRSVVVQRRVDGRWVNVTTARVRIGKYSTRVRTTSQAQRLRVVAGRLRSRVRVIPPTPPAPPTTLAGSTEEPTDEPAGGVPSDACGPRPGKADGSRWSCTFVDDFNGTELDRTKWLPQTQFVTGDTSGNYACYRDHPENISVSGGTLRLTVLKHKEALPCAHRRYGPSTFTAGSVSTYHLFSQQYGRFEARLKNTATTQPGLQEAFWMWPDDRQLTTETWPAAGEIDIVETYSHYPDHAIPFLHYTANDNGGPRPGLNTAWDCMAQRGVYNTYTLEWTAEKLEIFVNGKSCLVNTSGDPAFQKKYIIALTQALGVRENAYNGTAPLPATTTVDYVRIWN